MEKNFYESPKVSSDDVYDNPDALGADNAFNAPPSPGSGSNPQEMFDNEENLGGDNALNQVVGQLNRQEGLKMKKEQITAKVAELKDKTENLKQELSAAYSNYLPKQKAEKQTEDEAEFQSLISRLNIALNSLAEIKNSGILDNNIDDFLLKLENNINNYLAIYPKYIEFYRNPEPVARPATAAETVKPETLAISEQPATQPVSEESTLKKTEVSEDKKEFIKGYPQFKPGDQVIVKRGSALEAGWTLADYNEAKGLVIATKPFSPNITLRRVMPLNNFLEWQGLAVESESNNNLRQPVESAAFFDEQGHELNALGRPSSANQEGIRPDQAIDDGGGGGAAEEGEQTASQTAGFKINLNKREQAASAEKKSWFRSLFARKEKAIPEIAPETAENITESANSVYSQFLERLGHYKELTTQEVREIEAICQKKLDLLKKKKKHPLAGFKEFIKETEGHLQLIEEIRASGIAGQDKFIDYLKEQFGKYVKGEITPEQLPHDLAEIKKNIPGGIKRTELRRDKKFPEYNLAEEVYQSCLMELKELHQQRDISAKKRVELEKYLSEQKNQFDLAKISYDEFCRRFDNKFGEINKTIEKRKISRKPKKAGGHSGLDKRITLPDTKVEDQNFDRAA